MNFSPNQWSRRLGVVARLHEKHPILTAVVAYHVLLFLVVLGASYDTLFVREIFESGDFAVNALDVLDASVFSEIYGHYSRWHFQHPGPFYFYLFAGGEAILFHGLGLVASPYGAHAVTAVVSQIGFLGAGVYLLCNRLLGPALTPFFLIVLGLHFSMAVGVYHNPMFASVWPPVLLIGPTFLFIAASAAIASGQLTIPVVALFAFSGSVLVHLHVAQPVLVVPVACMAALAGYRNSGDLTRRRLMGYLAVAVLVIAPFIVPMAMDVVLTGGENFRQYVAYLQRDGAEAGDPLRGVLYLLSFFVYRADTYHVFRDPEVLGAFLQDNTLPTLFVAALFAVLAARLASGGARALRQRTVAAFAVILGAYAILSLVWASLMSGGHYGFNAYFFLSVVAVFWAVALKVWWGDATPPRLSGRHLGALYAIAVALIPTPAVLAALPDSPMFTRGQVHHAVAPLIDLDPDVGPVLVQLDGSGWRVAATVILYLERQGIETRVADHWGFMFDPGRTLGRHGITADEAERVLRVESGSNCEPTRSQRALGPACLHGETTR